MSSRQQFLLPNVTPGSRVRLDTASGSDSAADVVNNLNQAISGAIITADSTGRLASGDIYGPTGVTTLYMKTLDGSGNVTGSAVTLSGVHPTSSGSDPRVDTILANAPTALDTLKEIADTLASDESAATALTTAVGLRGIDVSHGSTAGTARPTSSLPVTWHGTVAPTNAVARDLWYDEANDLVKRYTGSAWVTAGGTSVPVPVDGDEGKVLTVSDPYTDGYELAAPTSGGGGLPIPGPNSAAQFTLVDLSAGLPAASLALQFDEPAGWIDDLDPAFGVSVDGTRLYVRSDAWYLANIAIDVEVTDGDTWPLLQFTGDWGLQPAELRGTLRSGDVGGGHRLFAFRATLLDALPDGYPSGPGDVGALGLTINCNGTGSIEAVSGAGVLLTTLAS